MLDFHNSNKPVRSHGTQHSLEGDVLCKYSACIGEYIFCYFEVVCSAHVHFIRLVDNTVHNFNTVLILSIYSINYCERSVDISNCNYKFVVLLSVLLVFFRYLKLCYYVHNTLGLCVYISMSFGELIRKFLIRSLF